MEVRDLDTPALVVDLDRLERNIARMAAIATAGGKNLRPHVKTHKTPEIARMQLAAGACGITVAKLGEAEVMATGGCADVLVANEIVSPRKLERLIALNRRARVAVAIDGREGVEAAAGAARAAGMRLPVRIEVDSGLHRAGARSVADAVGVARRIAGSACLDLDGVFTHEGHVYQAVPEARDNACAAAAAVARDAAEAIRAAGIDCPDVSVGSTPGASAMAHQPGVTEMRPGVYVFNDRMQVALGACGEDDCALTVLATVVSRPDRVTTIIDAGTKALSGDRALDGSRYGIVDGRPDAVFDWASEEHGHLDVSRDPSPPRVGETLRVIPHHACAAVNMHDTLFGVRGETVEAVWRVAARGMVR